MREQGQVAGGEDRFRLPPVAVQAPARLDADPAVPALAAEVRGEEAFSGVRVAQRPVDEDLHAHGRPLGDPGDLLLAQVALEDDPGHPHPRELLRRLRGGAAGLRAHVHGNPREEFVEDPHQPEIRRDDRVGLKRRHLVEQADRLGEVRLGEEGVHRHVEPDAAGAGMGPYAAKVREVEVFRPLARVELPEAQVDGVGPRVDGGVVRLRGPGGREEFRERGARGAGERTVRALFRPARTFPRLRGGGTLLPPLVRRRGTGTKPSPRGSPPGIPRTGRKLYLPGPAPDDAGFPLTAAVRAFRVFSVRSADTPFPLGIVATSLFV